MTHNEAKYRESRAYIMASCYIVTIVAIVVVIV